VLGVLIAIALAVFTTHKLHRMAWIAGIVGDAQVGQRGWSARLTTRN
jgi:hypothetical protein